MQPVHRFFELGQRQGVFSASELPFLKTLQAINDDSDQRFVAEPIRWNLFERPILELNANSASVANGWRDVVDVVSTTRPRIVFRLDLENLIQPVDFV
jgi:hypothetical protein